MSENKENKLKKPTTFEEQVKLLKSRGLIIHDEAQAIAILKRVNYYRLSAYMLSYKKEEKLTSEVSIRDVYSLYEFDKKLRNLMMEMLESIEIAFRTHIAYLIAHKYGALGYEKPSNFIGKQHHENMMKKLTEEIDRSSEIFIAHHKKKYEGLLPIWVAIEVSSFGLLSKIYSNLKDEDQEEIANQYYNLKSEYLRTWLHALSTFRNICAHYGRTYNRKLNITPRLFSREKKKGINNNTVFTILFLISRLLKNESDWDYYVVKLAALIEQYEIVDISLLGFPEDWEKILMDL